MPHPVARPLVGVATIAAVAGIAVLVAQLFRGGFTEAVPVTVVSPRAGLMMYPDAKVQMRGIQVGKVASIESLPSGRAAIHLAIEPGQLEMIPADVEVNIASTTVFGAKFVELVPPAGSWSQSLAAGQTLEAGDVTVEINTIFQRLSSVLAKIDPAKLNETLGAISSAVNGRGDRFGRTLEDFDSVLAEVNRSQSSLEHDIAVAPEVLAAYADSGTFITETLDNAAHVSESIVAEERNLDAFLVSMIGLADIGNDVLGGNRQALTDVMHLLIPTTDLTNQYHEALTCSLQGVLPLANSAPESVPGITISTAFTLGVDRYRYPADLPKVAAKGGPRCADVGMPNLPFESRPPFVVADVGSNPWKYGNQGLLLNADGLKQFLFGPLDGPPRNSAQIGQPG
nr:MCE family protein [Mycolicibacterium malmesburyense]CRL69555.1 MCE-family protein [Mycolicibacterium malmesburyense]